MQTLDQFNAELSSLGYGDPGTPGMSGIAQNLAAQGRGGDSMLVHMRPDEVAAMQQMGEQAGTSMTVNPATGLPEAFSLRDVFDVNTYTRPFRSAAEKVGLGGVSDAISGVGRQAAQYAPYIVPFIPGASLASVGLGSLASPMGRGILGGVAGAFGGRGRPSLQRGFMSGLTSYGLSSAFGGLQAAGGGGPEIYESMTQLPEGAGVQVPPGAPVEQAAKATLPTPTPRSEFGAAAQGIKNLMSTDKATAAAASKALGQEFGQGKAYATFMGVSGTMALDEQEKQLEAAKAAGAITEAEFRQRRARIDAAKERARQAVKQNPYQFAEGGLTPPEETEYEIDPYGTMFAAGGSTGRYVDGDGDGMSDSVPAVIGMGQPARLADGEFVIPADVVSHLGNGSTKAGAKQLYAMMDRVRKARTGNEEQGKQIAPAKYLPT